MTNDEKARELWRCNDDYVYFIQEYVWIESVEEKKWIPFDLWPAQVETLHAIHDNRLLVILKARQLGLTWLVLAYFLWLLLFRSIAHTLLFSKRADEAIELLDHRLKGMYSRLPEWMHAEAIVNDSKTEWELSTGSIARAFSKRGGDGKTATTALLDEFDLHNRKQQAKILSSVKPTVDAGGKLIMLSRANKHNGRNTPFKNTYMGAKTGANNYTPVFLPWSARPDRDRDWYDRVVADADTLDDVHGNYPETDAQALSPAQQDKRIPATWIDRNYEELAPYDIDTLANFPAIPPAVVEVYQLPTPGREYRAGSDPAEGNPTSNDSASEIVDRNTGEEVARIRGKLQPSTLARYTHLLATWYNSAPVLVERNNHGHAFILWYEENGQSRQLLEGNDGRLGWQSTRPSKALLYDTVADVFKHDDAGLHDPVTVDQLKLIDGNSLKSPDGNDDSADAYALATQARTMQPANKTATSGKAPFYK